MLRGIYNWNREDLFYIWNWKCSLAKFFLEFINFCPHFEILINRILNGLFKVRLCVYNWSGYRWLNNETIHPVNDSFILSLLKIGRGSSILSVMFKPTINFLAIDRKSAHYGVSLLSKPVFFLTQTVRTHLKSALRFNRLLFRWWMS